MLVELGNDKGFEKLIKQHIIAIMSHLFAHDYNFGVLCRIDHVTFEPDLSDKLKSEFRPLTLFYLAGYTFESALIEEDVLEFEAGFGAENIGSRVRVPLLDIIQIIVHETPIFVNSTAKAKKSPAASKQETHEKEARENSFEALMSNPENQRFLKKK